MSITPQPVETVKRFFIGEPICKALLIAAGLGGNSCASGFRALLGFAAASALIRWLLTPPQTVFGCAADFFRVRTEG
jgi:hypothetical protein